MEKTGRYDILCRKKGNEIWLKCLKNQQKSLTEKEKYGILSIYKRKKKKGVDSMLNDEICKLRDKLNESIETGEDYSIIYQISVELDELIAEYYRMAI